MHTKIQTIVETVDKACKIMRWRKLNDKQAMTVWNMVIIPRIEYQLLDDKLMVSINQMTKYMCNLSSSIPNFVLYEKDIMS